MAHHGGHSHASHDISHELGHIIPRKIYLKVLIALLILTAITVGVAQVNFGAWNIVVAMLIASIKAGLVTLFFMHLKYENTVTWLYVIFPIVLLAIMLGGIFIDNPLRISGKPQAATAPAEQVTLEKPGQDSPPHH